MFVAKIVQLQDENDENLYPIPGRFRQKSYISTRANNAGMYIKLAEIVLTGMWQETDILLKLDCYEGNNSSFLLNIQGRTGGTQPLSYGAKIGGIYLIKEAANMTFSDIYLCEVLKENNKTIWELWVKPRQTYRTPRLSVLNDKYGNFKLANEFAYQSDLPPRTRTINPTLATQT